MKKMIFLVMIVGGFHLGTATDWSYQGEHGPKNWKNMPGYEKCGGRRQSPINLDQSTIVRNKTLTQITFTDFDKKPDSMIMINNGRSVMVTVDADATVSGGGLKGRYAVSQFHFHFSSSNSKGSEHSLNDKKFPMEIHFVLYSTRFASFSEAVEERNGLATLSFFVKISREDNEKLDTIVSALDFVRYKGKSKILDPFPLDSFIPKSRKEYYRYQGSVTTPPCEETVTWNIFKNNIAMSQKQLNEFRKLRSHEDSDVLAEDKLYNNFRPTQPLNNRKVYSSFDARSTASLPKALLSGLSVSFLVMSWFL